MTAPVFLILFGGVFTVLGGLAYAGLWRSWARSSPRGVLLCVFWLGLAILSMGTAAFFFNGPLVGLGLGLMMLTVLAGILGIWSLLSGPPSWLLPGWFRATRRR